MMSPTNLFLVLCAGSAYAAEVFVMNGAGTTNPKKVFWKAMDLIMERARLPLHMTYRAVGSSTGQMEFVGYDEAPYKALNNFGAGDIPMSNANYDLLTAQGRKMLHVPFAMGAIGVFHSVPTAGLGGAPLDLTPCVLAKIFSTQITDWSDPEIRELNPSMTHSGPISVTHRVEGSSSTAGFTAYLGKATEDTCPNVWTLGTGSTIVWPAETNAAQGSGGMSDFIAATEGAIGYIDAGHGHAEGLGEVDLLNKDGLYLSTKEADIGAAGTLALSAVPSAIPTDPTSNFGDVNLYNLEGPTTWPITMITYFYLDLDMTSYDPTTAALVIYFVKYLLSEEGQDLAAANMFVKLPQTLLDYNAISLAQIQLPAGTPTFTTEFAATTRKRDGAGDYVVSGKRRTFAEYERTSNGEAIEGLQMADAEEIVATVGTAEWTLDEIAKVAIAALAIAVAGLVLGTTGLIVASSKARVSKPRSAEMALPARELEVPVKVQSATADFA